MDNPNEETSAHLANEARGLASEVKSSARELVTTEVEKRSVQGAEELSEVARALRQSGENLQGNRAAPYVRKAADRIEHLADYVRDAKPRDVLQSVTSFAQRDPVLFLSGAFAIGLFGSRFMKSGANPDSASVSGQPTEAR